MRTLSHEDEPKLQVLVYDILSGGVWDEPKLQALVYDILPSTTAVFSYAIGSRKLSANEQFFVVAQTVVGLLQTTQIVTNNSNYIRRLFYN